MAKAYPSELQQLVLRDSVTHFKPIRSSPEFWAGVTGVAKRVGGPIRSSPEIWAGVTEVAKRVGGSY